MTEWVFFEDLNALNVDDNVYKGALCVHIVSENYSFSEDTRKSLSESRNVEKGVMGNFSSAEHCRAASMHTYKISTTLGADLSIKQLIWLIS